MEPAKKDLGLQLRSLALGTGQRPADTAASGSGMRWVLVAAALLLGMCFGAAGFWVLLGPESDEVEPAAAQTVADPDQPGTRKPFAPEPATPVLIATGKIVSDHRVNVATKVSGQIVEMFVEQGDTVKKNQVIAKVEDVLYRAAYEQAGAILLGAQADLADAEWEFQRVSRLYERGDAPENEFLNTKHAYESMQARVAANQALLDQTRKRLDDCQIRAPISGVVLTKNAEVGDFVAAEGGRGANANAQLVTIADITRLRVEVDITEQDIDRLRRDMRCTVIPEAYNDRTYHGKVLWIDPLADYAKATVQVKVRIHDPDEFLRVEGTAKVEFHADEPGT